jgi:predicted NBD/HSP70 family sugar kinase
MTPTFGSTSEYVDATVKVLDLVRSGTAHTRPELVRVSGLGRNVVVQRLVHLMEVGLVEEGELGQSTGGRAPRQLRFRADAGTVLVAELGATKISVALSDLTGGLRSHVEEEADIKLGPVRILGRVLDLFSDLLAREPDPVQIWGVGIGLPGPVEFSTGQPVAPPIMPGWDGFDVPAFFARFGARVWVDNDVNLMALGELRTGLAKGQADVVYLKVGTGIGAGLVSRGQLHRGAQGCAGDVGHIAVSQETSVICRCGKVGCLEALAGGAALNRMATVAALEGRSNILAAAAARGRIDVSDIALAASHGDSVSVELLMESAALVGESLARIVNFFNPSVILIGGQVADAGDIYLAAVRHAVFSRSLPLATRNLQIVWSPDGDEVGLRGAAFMVIDELLSRELLGSWIDNGSPTAVAQLGLSQQA